MTTNTVRAPLEAFNEWLRTYNAKDWEGNNAMLDPTFKRYARSTDWRPMSCESYQEIFMPWARAYPDYHWEVKNAVVNGAWVAAQIIETGTFKNPFELRPGVFFPATGKHHRCEYAIFVRINEKGLLAEYHFYEDPSWPQQAGIAMDQADIKMKE
jgi:hypothetical protein